MVVPLVWLWKAQVRRNQHSLALEQNTKHWHYGLRMTNCWFPRSVFEGRRFGRGRRQRVTMTMVECWRIVRSPSRYDFRISQFVAENIRARAVRKDRLTMPLQMTQSVIWHVVAGRPLAESGPRVTSRDSVGRPGRRAWMETEARRTLQNHHVNEPRPIL